MGTLTTALILSGIVLLAAATVIGLGWSRYARWRAGTIEEHLRRQAHQRDVAHWEREQGWGHAMRMYRESGDRAWLEQIPGSVVEPYDTVEEYAQDVARMTALGYHVEHIQPFEDGSREVTYVLLDLAPDRVAAR